MQIWILVVLAIAVESGACRDDSGHPHIQASMVPASSARRPEAERAAGVTKEGDTVVVFIHHVRATRRAEYERWMQDVYMVAFRRAADRWPDMRLALARQRRLVPTQPTSDSTYTYVYLFEPAVGPPERGGLEGLLQKAGYSDEQTQRRAQELLRLITGAEGYFLVARQF